MGRPGRRLDSPFGSTATWGSEPPGRKTRRQSGNGGQNGCALHNWAESGISSPAAGPDTCSGNANLILFAGTLLAYELFSPRGPSFHTAWCSHSNSDTALTARGCAIASGTTLFWQFGCVSDPSGWRVGGHAKKPLSGWCFLFFLCHLRPR